MIYTSAFLKDYWLRVGTVVSACFVFICILFVCVSAVRALIRKEISWLIHSVLWLGYGEVSATK